MSKIHYFQRYSSVENAVTNNTLHLIARIYEYSPSRASELLTEMTGQPVEIGVEINQQSAGKASVPDGAIIQRSFKVLIESKVDAAPDPNQLLRHSDSFSREDQKILILLTREPVGQLEEKIRSQVSDRHPDVLFKAVTFGQVCAVVRRLFQDFEFEMRALVDDFIEYCNDAKLFDQSAHLLRIVPCGQSIAINRKHGVYFHPVDRGYTQHRYIGIYKDKAVRAIWEVDAVFDVDYQGGQLKKTLVSGRSTNDYDQRIMAIIQDAATDCGYDVAQGHRFFCGEPVDTEYVKESPGGIQGARFINVKDQIGEFSSVAELAAAMRTVTWR